MQLCIGKTLNMNHSWAVVAKISSITTEGEGRRSSPATGGTSVVLDPVLGTSTQERLTGVILVKVIQELEHLPCKERSRELVLLSL